ncbi:phospholipid scramblase 2-like isoform X2 [Drosophila rhopaloa]|uniref:Phospholipid scramblase n=1 Tax=Drosophila rhopaloa TaxID=1041015 RepID=A0ABM5HAC0_DRORH|nr:phospholipid scramblase 2-like isoform X2 [Drosophila rhopaloa]
MNSETAPQTPLGSQLPCLGEETNQVGDGSGSPPDKTIREPFHPLVGYPPGSVGYPPEQLPIVTQPGIGTGMARGGPAGDWKNKVEFFEAITGFETNNRYSIQNALGQKVFYAVEDTNCCTRNCCPERPFHMKVFDHYLKEEVIHLHRPLGCSSVCFPCCLHSIDVSAPPGNVIGSIEEEWSICRPSFRILNQSGDLALRIEGPMCFCSVCCNVDFNVVSLTGDNVGRISKKWSGLGREFLTDADMFGITFQKDMDVSLKAVLLGATFLIDFMFFEKSCKCLFKTCDCCLNI